MSHHNDQVSQCVWRTPERIRGPVHEVLEDFLDPCTDSDNPMGAIRFYTEDDDGLTAPWDHPRIFCNPPWSKRSPAWWWAAILWNHRSAYPDGEAIFVCPASINAQWFHKWILPANALCFPRGRVAYDMPPGFANDSGPTFDSCVAYFGRHTDVFKEAFGSVGWCPDGLAGGARRHRA